MESLEQALRSCIKDVPDFPKPGIVFKDIAPLFRDAPLWNRVTEHMAEHVRATGATALAAIESRGFLIGAPLALASNTRLVLIRKPGKLPGETLSQSYDLEYGQDRLEIQKDALVAGENVVVVDDVLATGGTAAATSELVERQGAKVVGLSFLMELSFLNGREKLRERNHEVPIMNVMTV